MTQHDMNQQEHGDPRSRDLKSRQDQQMIAWKGLLERGFSPDSASVATAEFKYHKVGAELTQHTARQAARAARIEAAASRKR